jgi:hypothetical protein
MEDMHATQVSPQVGGVITLASGLLLGVFAFLWASYSIDMQQWTRRMMGRQDSAFSDAVHRFTRVFGTLVLGASAVLAFAVGLAHAV